MNTSGPHAIICPRCSATVQPPLGAAGTPVVLFCNQCGAPVQTQAMGHAQTHWRDPPAPAPLFPPMQPPPRPSFEPQPLALLPTPTPPPPPFYPQPFRGHDGQMDTGGARTRHVLIGAFAALVVVTLIGVAFVALALNQRAKSVAAGADAFNQARTVTSLPAECAANEHLTVSHLTFAGVGTAINAASSGCVLTIENSTITSTSAVTANIDTKITVTDSTLVTSGVAINVGINGALTVSGASEIGSSTSKAIVGGLNTAITLNGTKVHALGTAIQLEENAAVALTGADVRGASGIVCERNATVSLSKSTTIKGTERGIALGGNAKIDVESSTVEGGTGAAIHLDRNAVINVDSSKLTGTRASIASESAPEHETVTASTLNGPRLVAGHVVDADGTPVANGAGGVSPRGKQPTPR